jgi:hypothetical protein
LAKYGIKLAVNAGVTDTKGLYEVVMNMVQAKGLDLKVRTHPYPLIHSSDSILIMR